MPNRNTDHVVIKGDRFRCLHCEAEKPIAMPIAISEFVAECDAFIEVHADCQKPK